MTIADLENLEGQAVFVSFSAEVNASTTESLLATVANCANGGVAEVRLLLSTEGGANESRRRAVEPLFRMCS